MSHPLPRQATSADLRHVIELLTQVWPEENNCDRWGEYLQEQEESGNGHAQRGVWVLDDGGTVLAVATVEFLNRRRPKQIAGRAWHVYLSYLTTHEDHRGQGHGARLEEHVLRELARYGYSGAYLRVNPEEPGWEDALDFWERQGWQRADTDGSRILMTKPTGPASPAPSGSA